MKPTLRWQFGLALIGLALVIALLLFQPTPSAAPLSVLSADPESAACEQQIPTPGGFFIEGFVGAPQFLNPLFNDPYPVDRQISDLLFDGLVRYDPQTRRYQPALAASWEVDENGRFVTFILRPDVQWHDGEPFTAEDVAFTYRLIQSPDFPGSPAARSFWQTVTIQVIDDQTIRFELPEPYSPFLNAVTRSILPEHLLTGETAASLIAHPFNQFPIGTGPFLVDASADWTQTGQLRLLPNPLYWANGTLLDGLAFQFYAEPDQLLAAFSENEVHGINQVPDSLIETAVLAADARIVTNPIERYSTLLFNQGEERASPVQAVEVRQALAYGLDRDQLVRDALNGQGLLFEGPYLPSSWAYSPATLTSYSFNPVSSTTALDNAGWSLGESGIRQREDTSLTLELIAQSGNRAMATAVAEQWRALGVQTELTILDQSGALLEALRGGQFDVALLDISPVPDPDLYDFWSQEAIIRGQNYAQWNNRRASEALEAGRQLWGVEQRRPFYDTFLRLYDANLPALTLYQHLTSYGINSQVQNVSIGAVYAPRDRYETFDQWFLQFTTQAIPCPLDT